MKWIISFWAIENSTSENRKNKKAMFVLFLRRELIRHIAWSNQPKRQCTEIVRVNLAARIISNYNYNEEVKNKWLAVSLLLNRVDEIQTSVHDS